MLCSSNSISAICIKIKDWFRTHNNEGMHRKSGNLFRHTKSPHRQSNKSALSSSSTLRSCCRRSHDRSMHARLFRMTASYPSDLTTSKLQFTSSALTSTYLSPLTLTPLHHMGPLGVIKFQEPLPAKNGRYLPRKYLSLYAKPYVFFTKKL